MNTSNSLSSVSEERAEHARSFLRFASSVYVTPMFLIFSVADYVWYPEHFRSFLVVRICAAAVVAVLTRLGNRASGPVQLELLSTLVVTGCAWPIHGFIYVIGEPSTPYYAGLELIAVGMASGLRLSWPVYAFNMAQIVLPFLAFGLLHPSADLNGHFLLNFVFLLSIGMIMTVNRWFTEHLHGIARNLRERLSSELENRSRVIAQKTSEAIELHALSRQFSPQIVSSLSQGQLKMVDRIHRAEICTVFVDIVGSTGKFITLDPDSLQTILAMFMADVMETFLKYDITIDKFLGDGVLAFANDPVPYPDYVERVMRASLEIKHRIQRRQDEYHAHWGARFEVTFGIATGPASVGFYGGELHVKSYTAIGRVVNLASRLAGAAGPDQILVSADVIANLRARNSALLPSIAITDTEVVKLKGFERDPVTVFSVALADVSGQSSEFNGSVEHCPYGHGLLFLAQERGGLHYYKCRHCEFALTDLGHKRAA